MVTILAPRPVEHRQDVGSWIAAALSVGFAAVYVGFAVGRHRAFSTGAWDLGIFEQAVRSYAGGRLPVSAIREPDMVLYGDHFSPILAVLAPVYKLWPAAETLLVAQALLFAVSVFPITRIAITLLGRGVGIAVGVCYGMSWGLQTALAFDFHEIAFAVPLLAFALQAQLRDQAVRAVAIAAPLVLVKEDLGVTLAVLGLLVALRPGHRRLGLWTALAGTAVSLLAVFVIVPGFSSEGKYRYLGVGGLQPTSDALRGQLLDGGKLHLVLLLLAPTLFLALRSPLILLAVPTLAWRLAGTNVLYWLPDFHYDAVLMPILFAAMIHGLVALRPKRVLASLLIATCAVIATQFPLREVIGPGFGEPPGWAPSAYALMDQIPDGATVATENELAPHLTSRTTVHTLSAAYEVDWVLLHVDRTDLIGALASDGAQPVTDGPLVLLKR